MKPKPLLRDAIAIVFLLAIVVWTGVCVADLIEGMKITKASTYGSVQSQVAEILKEFGLKAMFMTAIVTWSGPATALSLLAILCKMPDRQIATTATMVGTRPLAEQPLSQSSTIASASRVEPRM